MPLDPQAEALIRRTPTPSGGVPRTAAALAAYRAAGEDLGALGGASLPVSRAEDRRVQTPRGEVGVRMYTPNALPQNGTACPVLLPVLLYVHGGGFVRGSLDSHDTFCRNVTHLANCLVVSVDYRLAPEHPFPTATDDVYAMLQWLGVNASEAGGDAARIAIGGDSAGAGIAAGVALMARDRKVTSPLVFQALLYPAPDLVLDQPSVTEFADGYLLTREGAQWGVDQYAPPGVDRYDAYASPLRAADLSALPPALVLTAEYDPLRDGGEAYAARLRQAGVPVESRRYDGMIHNFVLMAGILDKGKEAVAQYADALRLAFAADGVAVSKNENDPSKKNEEEKRMEPSTTPDYIVSAEDVSLQPFNIPGFTGNTKAAFLNEDTSRAPYIALLSMEPGAVLRKHYHPNTTEAVYVVEGELINNGQPLSAGSCLSHAAGVVHGPHETRKGCTLMFIQTVPVGPEDSIFAD